MQQEKYNLFIGLEGVYALAGILLRKLGRVKTVAYYVSDYSPVRYGNTVFNKLYIWLDHFCIRHADFTWDVSSAMKAGRIGAGLPHEAARKILHIPNGLFPSQINPLPIQKRVRDSLVYVGILDPQKGIDLALGALKIVKTKRPSVTLHIIGGTKAGIMRLTHITRKLGIEQSVVFHGFVPPDKTMSTIIRQCYIGLGTYKSDASPENIYGDSGKIRQYLGCGLPIVSTNIQAYTKQVVREGAGIGTKENVKDFANGILTLLEDDNLYKRCSEKAAFLGKNNTWENSYLRALKKMGYVISSNMLPSQIHSS